MLAKARAKVERRPRSSRRAAADGRARPRLPRRELRHRGGDARISVVPEPERVVAEMARECRVTTLDHYEILAATREHHRNLCELSRFLDTVNLPLTLKHSTRCSACPSAPFAARSRTRACASTYLCCGIAAARSAPRWSSASSAAAAPPISTSTCAKIPSATSPRSPLRSSRTRHHLLVRWAYGDRRPRSSSRLPSQARAARPFISYIRFLFIADAPQRSCVTRSWRSSCRLSRPTARATSGKPSGRHLHRPHLRRSRLALEGEQGSSSGTCSPTAGPCDVLPQDAQSVIGKVGAQTRGVEKLLRRIGFPYAHRIDPFDGGPHYLARTDDIALVKRSRQFTVQLPAEPALAARPAGGSESMLLARLQPEAALLRGSAGPAGPRRARGVELGRCRKTRRRLGGSSVGAPSLLVASLQIRAFCGLSERTRSLRCYVHERSLTAARPRVDCASHDGEQLRERKRPGLSKTPPRPPDEKKSERSS